MFNIFKRKAQPPAKRRYGPKKKKTLSDVLEGAIVRQAMGDKQWALELALQKEGLRVPGKDDKEIEQHKKDLRKFITAEALNKIKSDPELAEQFIEGEVEGIMTEGRPRRRVRDDQPEYYGEPAGSSISQALNELDSLMELKGRMAELGGEEVESSKGFFGGLQLKDLLTILPQVLPYLVSGQKSPTQQQEPMYVVQVNGSTTQVTETQYHQLLQEGRVRPVAELAPPQEKPKQSPGPQEQVVAPQEEQTVEEPQIELPPLDLILEKIDLGNMEHIMNEDPDLAVMTLYDGKEGSEWSQYVWDMCASNSYEALMGMIVQHYGDDDRAAKFIELLQSDAGREWVEAAIDRIRNME